jgi:hypothetical protein
MSKSKGSSGGVGCLTVVGIVFIILKLVGLIDWSWWWVLAPFWGQLALAAVIVLVVSAAALMSKD